MTQLQTLDVSQNRLTSLPHLPPQLVSLYAAKNRLFFSPMNQQISKLIELQRLDLSDNQLS